ncbi:MAG TPA: DUF350 domain-containing protein [Pyrinomonadaceae bacterium]|nr:DUF350 domain-containing protein [Pyrinomonadaceae bacterium]
MLTRLLIAQANTSATPIARGMSPTELGYVLLSTAIFTLFGLIVFAIAYAIIVKAAPFSVRKELEEDHNIALAIVIGSIILGIALIIAAAIQG